MLPHTTALHSSQTIVFSYISFWYYINRFDAADYSASAFVCRRHHGGCWSCKAIECFLMWKLYMCDIEGRDVELSAWNLNHELQTNNSSISIGISFLKQRSTMFARWGFGRGVCVGGKAVGEGNRAFPKGRELRSWGGCFQHVSVISERFPAPPSLLLILPLLYICVIRIEQIRISCGCVASPSESSCFVNALFFFFFNLIFHCKAAAPTCLHNSSALCLSLFSSHCCFCSLCSPATRVWHRVNVDAVESE